MTAIVTCTACGAQRLTGEFVTPLLPVMCNVFPPDPATARAVPREALHLIGCTACGHLFNRSFDPRLLDYTASYETSLHHSAHFVAYAEQLAGRLGAGLPEQGATVLEIGCGRGDFLALFARAGRRCIGFDRSYDGRHCAHQDLDLRSADFDPQAHPSLRADLVICRHVLEHVPDPVRLLALLRGALAPGGTAYVEVPNGLWTLRDGGIWDLIYEHCSYFVPSSLAHVARRAGFGVRRVAEAYGGQFLQAELVADPSAVDLPSPGPAMHAQLGATYRAAVAQWSDRLATLRAEGRAIAAWGAGSKAVHFLNAVERAATIEHVVDRNPSKHGLCIPGTGQRVIAPAALRGQQRVAVLVMNPLYVNEVSSELRALGVTDCTLEAVS